ncbi:MAG TPA: methylamine dehydrogenase accessory protein MauD [Casimicrobiaceae bacterium]|nr:methylamine dehydrogenase accessory protein MauD [Casimicrobiaceae bacterium]
MEVLVVSNVVLWLAVVALLVVVFALARQIGVLYERVSPMGALMMDTGPPIGAAAPVLALTDLAGRPVNLGAPTPRSTLVFFLSPTCPVCKKLLPALKSAASRERRWLSVVLASDGDADEHQRFVQRAVLTDFPYVLSRELGVTYHVSKLPYAVVLDERGVVRAKGLVNSREQLESLFTAKELGVASIQDFVARGPAGSEHDALA